MQTNILRAIALAAALCAGGAHAATYPFQDPNLAPQQRIANILSLMTPDEKIAALSTNSGVPRLGIPSFGGTEGIHGVVQRGDQAHQKVRITTTQFPQPPGMGATCDPELVRQAGAVQSTEARYITQSAQYKQPMLMQWGPNPTSHAIRAGAAARRSMARILSSSGRWRPPSRAGSRATIRSIGAARHS